MANVISEKISSRGTRIRLVDDGNPYFHILTIEEAREYPDGCVAWFNICRPDEMWTNIEVAKREFLKV